jgi:hypothetical protein
LTVEFWSTPRVGNRVKESLDLGEDRNIVIREKLVDAAFNAVREECVASILGGGILIGSQRF